ncbi:MAG TPA: class I mannose-6-phosphate isomerase [Allosphingosinicella sp.]|nr:class I mannose-6-phosphate isomerase [Allosphingosinicella sp.]
MKFEPILIEKPWGRTSLPEGFADCAGRKIGEISFGAAGDGGYPLLAKYIFTSERLSVQVHPRDADARSRGLPHGKCEAWFVVAAEAGAQLGLGLKKSMNDDELRSAALDGSIEELLDWRPVKAGDFFYVPAGTIHAIGAGISLIEIQQNIDVTYRLYDYGRPRELHLDDAVAVASAVPYEDRPGPEGHLLLNGPVFSLARVRSAEGDVDLFRGHDRWVLPIAGAARCGSSEAGVGECLFAPVGETLSAAPGTDMLVAAAGMRSE